MENGEISVIKIQPKSSHNAADAGARYVKLARFWLCWSWNLVHPKQLIK
jgi:hypothetical protein